MVYYCAPLTVIAFVNYTTRSFIPNDSCHLPLRLLFVCWVVDMCVRLSIHVIVLPSQLDYKLLKGEDFWSGSTIQLSAWVWLTFSWCLNLFDSSLKCPSDLSFFSFPLLVPYHTRIISSLCLQTSLWASIFFFSLQRFFLSCSPDLSA